MFNAKRCCKNIDGLTDGNTFLSQQPKALRCLDDGHLFSDKVRGNPTWTLVLYWGIPFEEQIANIPMTPQQLKLIPSAQTLN